MIRKAFATIPHSFALLFCNFASSYPRSRRTPEPRPVEVAPEASLTIDEWPEHPDLRVERGLPYSDSVARTVDAGESLASVHDLVFVMQELHRVCAPNAIVTVRSTPPEMVSRDPTLIRPITNQTLEFFGTASRSARAQRAGAAGLFQLVETSGGVMRLRAVKKDAAAQRPTRIDLGSGSLVEPGYTGVDLMPLPGVAIVRDIERHGLPFSDSTITHVHTAHFLEHVSSLVFVMNEIHRVCCHDAIVDINVPTLLGPYAAADPTHVRLFNARTFSYFEAGSEPYAGITKGFQILEQRVGFSIRARLRVLKE